MACCGVFIPAVKRDRALLVGGEPHHDDLIHRAENTSGKLHTRWRCSSQWSPPCRGSGRGDNPPHLSRRKIQQQIAHRLIGHLFKRVWQSPRADKLVGFLVFPSKINWRTSGSAAFASGFTGSHGPPAQSVSSFSCNRSCTTPPKPSPRVACCPPATLNPLLRRLTIPQAQRFGWRQSTAGEVHPAKAAVGRHTETNTRPATTREDFHFMALHRRIRKTRLAAKTTVVSSQILPPPVTS